MQRPSSHVVALIIVSGLLAACRPRIASFEPHLGTTPEGAVARLGQGSVGWLDTSPDGRWLAVGNRLGLQVYRLPDFLPAWRADVNGLRGLSFSPGSGSLAGWADPQDASPGILLWETSTGELLETLPVDWVGIDSPVLTWNGDQPALLATQVFDPGAGPEGDAWSIRLIDLGRGQVSESAAQHRPATAFALTPQGSSLLTFTGDGIAEWDVATGQQIRSSDLHGMATGPAAWSGDGRLLALRMVEAIAVVDLQRGEVSGTFSMPDGPGAVAFDSHGERLAAVNWDGDVTVWETRTGERLAAWETDEDIRHLAWGGMGDIVIGSSWHGPIAAWRVSARERIGALEGYYPPPADIAWSPDATRLAITARLADRGLLLIWEPTGGAPMQTITDAALGAAAWSPDGREFAAFRGDGRLVIFNTQTWRVERSFPLDDVGVTDLAWSPDGSRLALALGDRQVWVVDAATGRVLLRVDLLPDWPPSPEFPANPVTSVSWSPDGARLAAGMWDGPGFVWAAVDGALVASLEHHLTSFPYFNAVLDIAWTPDGRSVVGAFNDGEGAIAVDAAGRTVLSPTDAVTIWGADTGERLIALQASPPLTMAMAVSPVDGRIAVSFPRLGVVRWDPQSEGAALAEELPRFPDHGDSIVLLLWSPNGRWLAGATGEGTVVLWDMTLP
jgi:WD40 repeat protein